MKSFSCNCFGNELKNSLTAVIDILNIEIESATAEKIDLVLDLKFSLTHTVVNKSDFLYISKINEFSGKLSALRIAADEINQDRKLPLNEPGESGYSGFVEASLTLLPDFYVILYMRPQNRFDKKSTFKVLGNSSPLMLDIERNNMELTPSTIKMSSKLQYNNSATPKSNKILLINSVRQLTFHTDEKESPCALDNQNRFSKKQGEKERAETSKEEALLTNDAFRKIDFLNVVIEEAHSTSKQNEFLMTMQSSLISSEAKNKFNSLTEYSRSVNSNERYSPSRRKPEDTDSQLKENLDPMKQSDAEKRYNSEIMNKSAFGPRKITSNQSEKALTSIKKVVKGNQPQAEPNAASSRKNNREFSSDKKKNNSLKLEQLGNLEKRRGSVNKSKTKKGIEKFSLGNQPFNQPEISKMSQLESGKNSSSPQMLLIEAQKMFPNLIIHSENGK